jgi:hypothetical protein
MDTPNPKLSIEFVTMSGEVLQKTSNLDDVRALYYSWTNKFRVKIIHTRDYSNFEDPDVFWSDTQFVFNEVGFNTFPDLIYNILTTSVIGANNVVMIIKSPEETYESRSLDDSDTLNFGIRAYLRRLR